MAITYECAASSRGGRGRRRGAACCGASSSRWPRCAATRVALGRPARPSRSSAATATWPTGRWPASSATPSATPSGRAPRTSCASTSAGPCGASRPTWPWWPGSSRALDDAAGHKVLAAGGRHRGRGAGRRPPGRRPPGGVDDDLQLLQPRRLAELLADTAEGALLLDEAAWALERDGDARKAAVARRFVAPQAGRRGRCAACSTPTASVLDHFDAITRYGPHRTRPSWQPEAGARSVPGTYPPWPKEALSKGSDRSRRPRRRPRGSTAVVGSGSARPRPAGWPS